MDKLLQIDYENGFKKENEIEKQIQQVIEGTHPSIDLLEFLFNLPIKEDTIFYDHLHKLLTTCNNNDLLHVKEQMDNFIYNVLYNELSNKIKIM